MPTSLIRWRDKTDVPNRPPSSSWDATTPTLRPSRQYFAHSLIDRSKGVNLISISRLVEAAHGLRSTRTSTCREKRRFWTPTVGSADALLLNQTVWTLSLRATVYSASFVQSLQLTQLPTDSTRLLSRGYYIHDKCISCRGLGAYCSVQKSMAKAVHGHPDNNALWHACFMFDSFILAPPTRPETFKNALRRHLNLVLATDTIALIQEAKSHESV